jgi:hypothetical protein
VAIPTVKSSASHDDKINLGLDLSIFRVGPGSGRAEKILLFRAEKILPMTISLGASDLNFRAGLRPGAGLGGPPAHFIV